MVSVLWSELGLGLADGTTRLECMGLEKAQ